MQGFLFIVLICLGVLTGLACCQNAENGGSGVYIVTLKQSPTIHYYEELRKQSENHFTGFHKPSNTAHKSPNHGSYIAKYHNSLLKKVLKGEKYIKLYSYNYLINGFAILVTPLQAEQLSRRNEVANIVKDFAVKTATTHTPQFLGLPQRAWPSDGGYETAGEGIVIGFVDTGIDPTRPSFFDNGLNPYPVPRHFSGICEVTKDFPSGSCNRKLVAARHFAESAITRGIFNATQDYASPFDGDGHGTHTASTAAGNHGIPVVVAGHHFGDASGMAPRSHIAVYKALYKSFGGFAADVVAAIDQAAEDGVDIISLSITPNRRPPGIATFFNPIDMALLSAVKKGIFVVQAAGNTGPSPRSISSFSPWIFTVGAATHDRVYTNSIVLGNNVTIQGVGLAPGTYKDSMYTLVLAVDALNDDIKTVKDENIGECQDPTFLNKNIIKGKLLICSYSIRFVLGMSTIKKSLETAKNVSAAGVVFYMDPFVLGFQLNPVPMGRPGIIISSPDDSKLFMQYYNSSLSRTGTTKKIVKFGGLASISGGLRANYSTHSAPKIMYFSARGPNPEDTSPHNADILKPNLVAPGNFIWAAWSSRATDSIEFLGEDFAIMSGTSMAAPHVAGLAALLKKKFPELSPFAIGSALSTTALVKDKNGGPIMAQRAYANPDLNTSPATPFDMGSGFVNPAAALDPGLVFDSSYDDYLSFLCGINGSSPIVLNYTSQSCGVLTKKALDLNLPSITISQLNQTRLIQRTVTNIANNETYIVGWTAPYGVSIKVKPTRFSIATGEKKVLNIFFIANMSNSVASFGRIGLLGSKGHSVHIPLSVITKIL